MTRLTFLIVLISFLSFTKVNKLYKQYDIPKLTDNLYKDSINSIEILASKKFHNMLNSYRIKNGLKPTQWNDTFWLACYNHNLYMTTHSILSHKQIQTKRFFSGKNGGERLQFAFERIQRPFWSGENCLYHFTIKGNSIENIAQNIAQKSFEMWRDSDGHKNNMLKTAQSIHAASFVISGRKVFGTSLFGVR